jgi:predicted ester cyclase
LDIDVSDKNGELKAINRRKRRQASSDCRNSFAFFVIFCSKSQMVDLAELRKFARRYAEAWCSHNPESVAAFFAKNASISVNNRPPAAIGDVARGFMRDFPDMIVTFDKLEPRGDRVAFHWTLTGTNTGPGGTGKRVRISGYELWKIDNDGLIAESEGHFDAADYERQLKD